MTKKGADSSDNFNEAIPRLANGLFSKLCICFIELMAADTLWKVQQEATSSKVNVKRKIQNEF